VTDPRKKPERITVRPGQKWATADRTITAIVTSILQDCSWSREDITTVSYLRYLPGAEATLERTSQEAFVATYPVLVD
jgi:hypothetical protein